MYHFITFKVRLSDVPSAVNPSEVGLIPKVGESVYMSKSSGDLPLIPVELIPCMLSGDLSLLNNLPPLASTGD